MFVCPAINLQGNFFEKWFPNADFVKVRKKRKEVTVLREYMERAIALAEKGMGFTSPNPMVGAVIVKDNQVIAEGYHHKYGELHAEREAFADLQRRYGEDAGKMAKGATM